MIDDVTPALHSTLRSLYSLYPFLRNKELHTRKSSIHNVVHLYKNEQAYLVTVNAYLECQTNSLILFNFALIHAQ